MRILKDFRLGLDKNERGSILTLHEMYTCEKQQKFYEFLGMKKDEIQEEVNNIVTLKSQTNEYAQRLFNLSAASHSL